MLHQVSFSEINFKEKVEIKSPLELGKRRKTSSLGPFSGLLSDFNIWNRPLSIEEIKLFTYDCRSELVMHNDSNIRFVTTNEFCVELQVIVYSI